MNAILDFFGEYGVTVSVLIAIVKALIWIVFGIVFSFLGKRLVIRVLRLKKEQDRKSTLVTVVSKIVKIVIWFIVLLGVLSEFDINIAPIIASAGVIGLAIGFGSQKLVEDFIGGFFLVLEETLVIGHIVEIDGFTGEVIDIGLRTTKIKDWRGSVKIIGNGDINSLINYSLDSSIAVIDFGVAYETNINELEPKLKQFTSDIHLKYEAVIEPAQYLGVIELADSSVNLRIIATCKSFQHFQVERDLKRDIKAFLESINVEIPFPQVVYTKKV